MYPILPEGLGDASVRKRAAEQTLHQMARETGGRAFLRGESARNVAARVHADGTSTWLLSFPPGGLERDQLHSLAVRTSLRGVGVRTQSAVIVHGAPARKSRRILAAFADPDRGTNAGSLDVGLVPVAFESGRYRVLAQVAAGPGTLARATWDLGASLVRAGRVETQASGRVETSGGASRVVLESEVWLPPGAYEAVAVASETESGEILSRRVEVSWRDPDRESVAAVGPTAVIQAVTAVFSRDGAVRRSGSLAHDGSPLGAGKETAFLTLVCRGRSKKRLEIARSLVGQGEYGFGGSITLPPPERCGQVRDLVPTGYLAEGAFRYRLTVLETGVPQVSVERAFDVLAR